MISEALIGVIIGGVIATFSQYMQINHSKKDKINDKKEETYLKAIEVMSRWWAEIPQSKSPDKCHIKDELKVEYNNTRPAMTIYGTGEIYEYFTEIIVEIGMSKMQGKENDEKIKKMMIRFNTMVLKDLGK